MSIIAELFGYATNEAENWSQIVEQQQCIFLKAKCFKVRKSDPAVSIGTCSVQYGRPPAPVVICPARLLERRQVFIDCLHLLTSHEPGNELHIVPEVAVPGGNVDYFLVSVRDGRVKDFVGIELQALDTTGTIWPERQRFLRQMGITDSTEDIPAPKAFGVNWKMTAKTTLVQLHHKVQTFEHVNKKLVLVLQDRLLGYMSHEFNFRCKTGFHQQLCFFLCEPASQVQAATIDLKNPKERKHPCACKTKWH